MKIVVIGGSGLIGKKLVKLLGERGHEVVAASPSTGVNAVTGEGLAEALMLRRAACTIYFAQENDTLGKDSELASTLAQGKPVIAFVPAAASRRKTS